MTKQSTTHDFLMLIALSLGALLGALNLSLLNEVKNMMLWSLAAGGAILWGTCLVVFCQEKIQEKTLAIMMALAAGVMMAGGVFDLLIPAIFNGAAIAMPSGKW